MKNISSEIKRVNGYLREIVTVFDSSGKPVSQVLNPVMVELKPRDVFQLLAGSFIIASPLCFTEEVWKLSEEMTNQGAVGVGLSSFVLITCYIYFNFYRNRLRGFVVEFLKRVLATYVICTASIAISLLVIGKLPWDANLDVALRRITIIAFPAAFGAVISDNIK